MRYVRKLQNVNPGVGRYPTISIPAELNGNFLARRYFVWVDLRIISQAVRSWKDMIDTGSIGCDEFNVQPPESQTMTGS